MDEMLWREVALKRYWFDEMLLGSSQCLMADKRQKHEERKKGERRERVERWNRYDGLRAGSRAPRSPSSVDRCFTRSMAMQRQSKGAESELIGSHRRKMESCRQPLHLPHLGSEQSSSLQGNLSSWIDIWREALRIPISITSRRVGIQNCLSLGHHRLLPAFQVASIKHSMTSYPAVAFAYLHSLLSQSIDTRLLELSYEGGSYRRKETASTHFPAFTSAVSLQAPRSQHTNYVLTKRCVSFEVRRIAIELQDVIIMELNQTSFVDLSLQRRKTLSMFWAA